MAMSIPERSAWMESGTGVASATHSLNTFYVLTIILSYEKHHLIRVSPLCLKSTSGSPLEKLSLTVIPNPYRQTQGH